MVLINNNKFYSINYDSQELIIIYPNVTKDSFLNVPESVYSAFKNSNWAYSFFTQNIKGKFDVYENDKITFEDEIPEPEMPATFDG